LKNGEKRALSGARSLTPDLLHDRIFSIDGGEDPFGFYKQNSTKNNTRAFRCGKKQRLKLTKTGALTKFNNGRIGTNGVWHAGRDGTEERLA